MFIKFGNVQNIKVFNVFMFVELVMLNILDDALCVISYLRFPCLMFGSLGLFKVPSELFEPPWLVVLCHTFHSVV